MGKALFGLLLFGGLFIGLIFWLPVDQKETVVKQSQESVSNSVSIDEIKFRIQLVCENAISSYIGIFDDSQNAVDSCKEILLQHYNSLGVWPGPQMVTSTCSAAFLAAKDVSESWAGLDFSSANIVYRAEDAREVLMQKMKEQRLAMGL